MTATIAPTTSTPTASPRSKVPAGSAGHATRPTAGHTAGMPAQVTFGRVARAELFKFGTVRSNMVTLFGSATAAISLGMLFSQVAGTGDGPQFTNGLSLSLAGFDLAMIIVAILGVSTVAVEYQTGLIRGWFATAPGRLRVLGAKVGVLSGLAFIVTATAALIAFLAGQALLPDTMTAMSLTDDGVWQALAGTALYAAVIAAIGVSLGFLLRSTAAGSAVVVSLLLILPIMIGLLPAWISDPVGMILPSNAVAAITGIDGGPVAGELLSATGGVLALGAWAAASTGAAAIAVKTRDA